MLRLIPLALLVCAPLHAQSAKVTVLHGIPGLPAPVEVFANGNSLFTFDFPESRGPLDLPAGNYNLEVRLQGQTVLSTMAMLNAGDNVTVVAYDNPATGLELGAYANSEAPLGSRDARVAVRHNANAPAVDIQLAQDGQTVATIPNLTNPQEAVAELPSGIYDVSILAAGTSNVVAGPLPLSFQREFVYGIHAIGNLNGGTFQLFLQEFNISTRPAKVTVLHGIPGLPAPVEVFANGNSLFTFDFPESRGPLELPAGTYNLEVRLQGQTVLSTTATLEGGDNVTVVAYDNPATGLEIGAYANSEAPLDDDDARVAVRHNANAPAVDIRLSQGGQTIATIANLTNPQEAVAEIPADLYDVTILAAGTSNVVAGPLPLRFQEEFVYGIHAIGNLNGGTFQLFLQQFDISGQGIVITVDGQSCGGAIAASNSRPAFGEDFDILLLGALPNTPAFYVFGRSDTVWNGVPLPLDLGHANATGCFLYTSVEVVGHGSTNASGSASVTINIPVEVTTFLDDVYAQWGYFAPGANSLGALFTNYLEIERR